jgi:chemotaxis protein MotB
MRKRKHEEEHENHERWLVSYADFITLLFAFFVVMYSVSRVDNQRLSKAAVSIKWALHMGGTGGSGEMPIFEGPSSDSPVDMGGSGPVAPPQIQPEVVRRKLEKKLRPLLLERTVPIAVHVMLEGQLITIRLTAAEFFDPAQAALRPDILPILDAIADELVPLERPLRVEGHTDDTPVLAGRFHDNWDLSAARAASVASYLEQAHHARPELLMAVGYAASRPIAPGKSPEARETNRRVELVAELGVVEPSRRK